MENFTPTHYTLECVATGRQFEDEGWMLDDPCCKIPSMIRTRYAVRQIDVRPDSYGFYKFCAWLPDGVTRADPRRDFAAGIV